MEYAEFDGYVHISCFELEIHFSANLVLKITSVQDEIWCQVQFEYAEFGGNIHLPYAGREMPFWGSFDPKKSKLTIQAKICDPFGGNLVQKIKTVLAEILFLVEFENAEFYGDLHFFNFKREIPFLGRLV